MPRKPPDPEHLRTLVLSWFRYEVVFDDHRAPVSGTIRLIDPDGTSVISDIDDTIKITMVTDKAELVRNTFMRPYRPANGMPALYRSWAQRGCVFHFVSSSPWQLFEPLSEFVREAKFPPASYALKSFREKVSRLLELLADPMQTKPQTIMKIIDAIPSACFVWLATRASTIPRSTAPSPAITP